MDRPQESDRMNTSEETVITQSTTTITRILSNNVAARSLPSLSQLFPLPSTGKPHEMNDLWARDNRNVPVDHSSSSIHSRASIAASHRYRNELPPPIQSKQWNSNPSYTPTSVNHNHAAIYDSYGSSVVSINPLAQPLRPPASSSGPTPTHTLSTTETPFDPERLGLPVPPEKTTSKNWAGLYSSSGFDLVGVLARVVLRPDPELVLGPIDLSCSFVVCDATLPACPILYASETFSRMTCYDNEEVLGQNCRFLQSPEGAVHHKHKRPDNNLAALEMKNAIANGRESQVSLVNYHKGGRPFMNLVSIIPVTWDTDKISYFVGFQVDLGAQPSAVNHMSDGTFCVNYSQTRDIPPTIRTKWPVPDSFGRLIVAASAVAKVPAIPPMKPTHSTMKANQPAAVVPMVTSSSPDNLGAVALENFLLNGVGALSADKSRMAFNRLVIEQAIDFVHVLTLKGTLLYVSPTSRRLLDFDPDELTGQSLASFCHPSDVVNVLRDMKELAAGPASTVTLLYRMKRKDGSYVWLESTGKLLIQPGKGRKCVILSGRPREVHRLSKEAINSKGGFGEQEFWSKLSADGKVLYSTPQIEEVLGYTAEEVVGTSIEQLSPDGAVAAAIKILESSTSGDPVTIQHIIEAKSGPLDVVTHLYPNKALFSTSVNTTDLNYFAVIAQTNLYSSEKNKRIIADTPTASASASSPAPSLFRTDPIASTSKIPSVSADAMDESPSASSAAEGGYISTYKTLSKNGKDNLFSELEVTHGASIHFELQQLRLANKKLREERDLLLATQALKRPPVLPPKIV